MDCPRLSLPLTLLWIYDICRPRRWYRRMKGERGREGGCFFNSCFGIRDICTIYSCSYRAGLPLNHAVQTKQATISVCVCERISCNVCTYNVHKIHMYLYLYLYLVVVCFLSLLFACGNCRWSRLSSCWRFYCRTPGAAAAFAAGIDCCCCCCLHTPDTYLTDTLSICTCTACTSIHLAAHALASAAGSCFSCCCCCYRCLLSMLLLLLLLLELLVV